MTQKDMEQRFGCKILIRGRGSQRDGSSGVDGAEEELHVCVEGPGDSVAQVRDCCCAASSSSFFFLGGGGSATTLPIPYTLGSIET
jgi:hypothetical protein